ncbi:hypothetical protein ACSQ67_024775 [Phaseolus vulgaris]
MLKHNTSHNLLKVDVSRLQDANVDFICGDAENLLSRVTTLRHEVKRRRSSFEEGKLTQKEVNWNMTVEGLKNEIVGSYGVSFEDIVEQVVIIHPTIDFSKLNSYNVVVDGRIVRNL